MNDLAKVLLCRMACATAGGACLAIRATGVVRQEPAGQLWLIAMMVLIHSSELTGGRGDSWGARRDWVGRNESGVDSYAAGQVDTATAKAGAHARSGSQAGADAIA